MRQLTAVFVVLVLATAAGCTYNQGSLIGQQYSSIRVPMFDNTTRDRDIEFALTRAVKNELERKHRLTIVDDPGLAQTELTGTITDFNRYVLTEDRLDRVRELSIVVTLTVVWTDLERQIELKRFVVTEAASARVGIGETEDQATQEALRLVAQRILEGLEESW